MTIQLFGYVFITRNSHSLVIAIPQNEVQLFLPKRNVIAIHLPYVITIKYKISKIPYQNICFYLYLASFSLLLFIFLIKFSLSPLSLSCSSSFSPGSLSLSLSLSLSCSSSSSSGSLSLLFLSQTIKVIFFQLTVEILSISYFSLWLWRFSLSPLSLSVRLVGIFNLCSTNFFFSPRFSICTILVFFSFFFLYILYNHCC